MILPESLDLSPNDTRIPRSVGSIEESLAKYLFAMRCSRFVLNESHPIAPSPLQYYQTKGYYYSFVSKINNTLPLQSYAVLLLSALGELIRWPDSRILFCLPGHRKLPPQRQLQVHPSPNLVSY